MMAFPAVDLFWKVMRPPVLTMLALPAVALSWKWVKPPALLTMVAFPAVEEFANVTVDVLVIRAFAASEGPSNFRLPPLRMKTALPARPLVKVVLPIGLRNVGAFDELLMMPAPLKTSS